MKKVEENLSPDACLIIASYNDAGKPVTLSKHKDLQETKDALWKMFAAFADQDECFIFPESRLYYEQKIIHDARTRRKGGS